MSFFNYNKYQIANDLDCKALIKKLEIYYNTSNEEILREKVKNDLKDYEKLSLLLEFTQYDSKELIYHLISIYGKLFNKLMIKKVREQLDKLGLR